MAETTATTGPTATEASPEAVVAALTLAEKARLVCGGAFWNTLAVERVGLPAMMLTDGPHGLRKQRGGSDHLGLGDSVPATCFPPAVGLGASFDPDLAHRVGAAIAREALAEGVGVVLGPGINLKRSLLCGRNFEYFSEDPFVSGVMGSALVQGQQGGGVGSSLKHFAANNQEHDRMRVSAEIDERPLRELYLRSFQKVVTGARPWTVMCSYNRVNGVRASENPFLLTEVLRGEWGFEGLVVSDWGAVADRVASIAAGLDLEMPGPSDTSAQELVEAVGSGALAEGALDTAAVNVVRMVRRAVANVVPGASWSEEEHHRLAREVAAACVVLLKNQGSVLPLRAGQKVAVVGELAAVPRYQGAGSSLINPTRLDNAVAELTALGVDVSYAAGYRAAGGTDAQGDDQRDAGGLVAEAVAAASAADVVVAFLGVPAAQESEGFDREHIELPAEQLALLEDLVTANPRVVVVLSNGGVVRLSGFADRVPAIVEGWLLGQGGGGAIADVLTGAVNPSGRLTETIPQRLADSPAYLDFPGEHGQVRYGEGLFVGYRWYDARELEVTYPFGHGLSYTTFVYSGLAVTSGPDGLDVTVDVANTGDRDGHEVVQVYVGVPGSAVVRAPRELKAFVRIQVPAGESRTVALRVDREDLAYWDTRIPGFLVEAGAYDVHVGSSSRDLRGHATVTVAGDDTVIPLTLDATLGEFMADPTGRDIVRKAIADSPRAAAMIADPDAALWLGSLPLARFRAFGVDGLGRDELPVLVETVNAARRAAAAG